MGSLRPVPKGSLSAVQGHLTAAGTTAAGKNFLEAVTKWLSQTDHSPETWRAMLQRTLGPTLDQAVLQHSMRLSSIMSPTAEARRAAIKAAIEHTEDLRLRLLKAPDNRDQQEFAFALWGIKSLLDAVHQSRVVQSIIQHANNILEYNTFKEQRFESGFTGRRKFNAGDSDGRHAAIDGQIDSNGEGWVLPDRVGLPSKKVLFVADDPQDPAEWSNTTSRISYEHIDRKGKQTWRFV